MAFVYARERIGRRKAVVETKKNIQTENPFLCTLYYTILHTHTYTYFIIGWASACMHIRIHTHTEVYYI